MAIENPLTEEHGGTGHKGWFREHMIEIFGVLVAVIVGYIVYVKAKSSGSSGSSVVTPAGAGPDQSGLNAGSNGGGTSGLQLPFSDPSASAPNGGQPSVITGVRDMSGLFNKVLDPTTGQIVASGGDLTLGELRAGLQEANVNTTGLSDQQIVQQWLGVVEQQYGYNPSNLQIIYAPFQSGASIAPSAAPAVANGQQTTVASNG